MTILFNIKCRQKDLSHRINERFKSQNNDDILKLKYENKSLTDFMAAAEKLNIEVASLGFGIFELKKGDIRKRVTNGLGYDTQNMVTNYMCKNKYLVYKILERENITCFPRHSYYKFKDVEKTIKDFKEWNCRVVIKPCTGTYGGRGVTVNIKNEKELKNAIAGSYVFDRKAYLMEQYITGSHYRLMTLKGEYLYCCQRIPARVFGNGKDTINKLIIKENQRRISGNCDKFLYPIVVDNEVKRKLKSLNKTMDSIPADGEEFFVKDVINMHSGGEIIDIFDVSKEIKDVCKEIANILDIYLTGFDIITNDISKSFDETKGVINETNTAPGIEDMYIGTNSKTPVHVAEIILKDIFNL